MQPANILVVDDDAVARELLSEALKKEGYAVEAFASGEEVIARGRQGRSRSGSDRYSYGRGRWAHSACVNLSGRVLTRQSWC